MNEFLIRSNYKLNGLQIKGLYISFLQEVIQSWKKEMLTSKYGKISSIKSARTNFSFQFLPFNFDLLQFEYFEGGEFSCNFIACVFLLFLSRFKNSQTTFNTP